MHVEVFLHLRGSFNVFVCSSVKGVCVSVCVSEKESDSEVSVGGAEAALGFVGVRYFVDT